MKLLPGSLTATGAVIDYVGREHDAGPCFIPSTISAARKGMMGNFGWCITPARDWPSVLPAHGLACIYRPTRSPISHTEPDPAGRDNPQSYPQRRQKQTRNQRS